MADARQMNDLRGKLEKMLSRIATDSAYHQQLLDDPLATLAAAALDVGGDAPDVVGYACRLRGTCGNTCGQTCAKNPDTCGKTTSCRVTSVKQ